MSRRTRRNHTPAFKAKVALAAIKGGPNTGSVGGAVRRPPQSDHGVESPARGWSSRCFGPGGSNGVTQPTVDVKSLHAKIGEAAFCVETLEEALAKHGKPEIFNTDQGSQFTGAAFTGLLIKNGIAISMDGKCWRDNVFVERLWRSMKYEEVYLRAYDSVGEACTSIGRYLDFYNRASEHPSCYVIEEKRLCWPGCDPAGYLGFCRARSVIDRAADVVSAARAKTHGPSGRGWIASISPASAASRNVLGAIRRSFAALLRLSHGSIPSSAGLNTGMR